MVISGKGLLHFYQETSSLMGSQAYHRTNMFLPYESSSHYESDYECICIYGKTCSVPLNILSSVCSLPYMYEYTVWTKPCRECKLDSYRSSRVRCEGILLLKKFMSLYYDKHWQFDLNVVACSLET